MTKDQAFLHPQINLVSYETLQQLQGIQVSRPSSAFRRKSRAGLRAKQQHHAQRESCQPGLFSHVQLKPAWSDADIQESFRRILGP
ncbi:hypothetical protein [Ectobacillus ponti]|uniref:Uncharacterized protein n=1 Tax=Ectobacillus ponti TaxID=2961894 RepID=A0AA41X6L5_9BACI|nr:hypothetical protein [Ectobacillus ponti]MCP8969891.1 hypothetical protein [Ectobacillus ponti]